MTRKKVTVTKVLIIICSMSILLATPVMALPLMPHTFYGSVLIDGSPAPDGLNITATIAGVTFPHPVTTITANSKYGYDFQFKVPADDAETTIKEGGVAGDIIIFSVDGFVAGNYSFEIGQVTNLNLSITPTPPSGRRSLPDPSTWAMVGNGLGAVLLYIGLSRLRWRLKRN